MAPKLGRCGAAVSHQGSISTSIFLPVYGFQIMDFLTAQKMHSAFVLKLTRNLFYDGVLELNDTVIYYLQLATASLALIPED